MWGMIVISLLVVMLAIYIAHWLYYKLLGEYAEIVANWIVGGVVFVMVLQFILIVIIGEDFIKDLFGLG